MQQIDNSRILQALIRGFFDALYCGLTDYQDSTAKELIQPKKIKEVMTENYEKISVVFNDTLFYPISCLNYTYDEVTEMLKGIDPDNVDMLELVKKACRTDECFETMKNGYCRNLLTMLEGRYPTLHGFFEEKDKSGEEKQSGNGEKDGGNNANEQDRHTDSDAAIGMAVRTVMTAYAQGLRQSGKTEVKLHQCTLFRLVLDAVTTLLHDAPIDSSHMESFEELVMAVCKTSHNIDVMTDEMNRMHEELIFK